MIKKLLKKILDIFYEQCPECGERLYQEFYSDKVYIAVCLECGYEKRI